MKSAFKPIIFITELTIVLSNFFIVYFIQRHFRDFFHLNLIPDRIVVQVPKSLDLYQDAFWASAVIWVVVLWWRRGYRDLHIQTSLMAISHLALNGFIFLFLFTSVSFLLKFDYLSRGFILLYTTGTTILLIINRLIFLEVAKRARKKGHDRRRVLLAGTGRRAQEFISHLAKHTEWGYQLVGLIDRDATLKGEIIAGYPVLGVLEDLPFLLEKEVVDEIFFVTPRDWLDDVRKCVLYCEAIGVPATISTDLFDFEIASASPKVMEGKTYLTLHTRLPSDAERLIKRILDIFVSSIALVLSSPIFFIVALAIKLTSPGPIFFHQTRSGVNGRRFKLYKFRSMEVNAEKKLAELQSKNEMTGPVFKLTNDPRITKVGKFIRKTSLDEFPQFWNVFKGDMSVVGPRPPLPAEVEKYEPWQRRRLSMKPGITCIWQVSGRHDKDFEKWMDMDLTYIDRWSFLLDLKILILTAKAVFVGSGK